MQYVMGNFHPIIYYSYIPNAFPPSHSSHSSLSLELLASQTTTVAPVAVSLIPLASDLTRLPV